MATQHGANTVAVSTSEDAACQAARAALWWTFAELLEPSLQAVDIAALREMLDAAAPPAALQEIWGDLRSALGAIRLDDRPQPEIVLQCGHDLRVVARLEDARAFNVGVAEARNDSATAERIRLQLGDFLSGPGAARIEAAAAVLATWDAAAVLATRDASAQQPLGRALLRLLAATRGCEGTTSISVNASPASAARGAIGSAAQSMLRSPEAA